MRSSGQLAAPGLDGPALLGLVDEVGGHGVAVGLVLLGVGRAERGHALSDQRLKSARSSSGTPEELGDDDGGQRVGDGVVQVTLAVVSDRVDEADHERLDPAAAGRRPREA